MVSWVFPAVSGLGVPRPASIGSRTGLIAHETIVAGALERNRRLLDQLSKDEVAMLLLGYIDRP